MLHLPPKMGKSNKSIDGRYDDSDRCCRNSLELAHDSARLHVPLHELLTTRSRVEAASIRGERHRGNVWETLSLSKYHEESGCTCREVVTGRDNVQMYRCQWW